MELISLPESKPLLLLLLLLFTLAENVKLDVLIRIRLKKVTSHS